MKLNHLMLTSVLALALLGSAACSSTEDASSTAGDLGGDNGTGTGAGAGANPSDPGSGVVTDPGASAGGETKTEPQPVAGGNDPETLGDALGEHKDTERINFQVLADDCGRSTGCLEELKELQDYVTSCADCPPAIANFNNTVSNSMLQSGSLPTTLPQVKDVIQVYEDAAAAGDDSADAGAMEPGVDTAIDDVVADLNKMGDEETDWNSIVKMADPADQAAFESTVKDALSSLANDETAKSLLAGDMVPASEAAKVIDNATANP